MDIPYRNRGFTAKLDTRIWPALIAAGASLVGGMMNKSDAKADREYNAYQNAHKYQIAVKDAKACGPTPAFCNGRQPRRPCTCLHSRNGISRCQRRCECRKRCPKLPKQKSNSSRSSGNIRLPKTVSRSDSTVARPRQPSKINGYLLTGGIPPQASVKYQPELCPTWTD